MTDPIAALRAPKDRMMKRVLFWVFLWFVALLLGEVLAGFVPERYADGARSVEDFVFGMAFVHLFPAEFNLMRRNDD